MPGVTEQEIAQAKQMNLYQYMQLCEPDNFKPEGPGQFRHKGHSSLTFAEDGSWTYFKTKATGRTALNYLIAVEGVSFVEAVREINRIQGGVRPSFQPVKTPPPPAEKKPAKEFRLPKPDKNNYAATAYLRKRCIELYVYNAMASLSIATLCYQELHGIAVNFLKSYLAVALQGAVLYLVIGFYPALAGSLGTGGSITEQAWAMLGQSVILLVAVFMSGKFTKAITNAMT